MHLVSNKILYFLLTILMISCSTKNDANEVAIDANDTFIRAADISFVPLITKTTSYFNSNNQIENPLLTLQKAGCNTIRVRLWVNPADGTSSLAEVKLFSQQIKNLGLKVWLCVHYSDTWADPGNQKIPKAWSSLNFENLKQTVAAYTQLILSEIKPDIIQIGNEINSGFLWPIGHLYTNENQCLQLLSTASAIIRKDAPNTKIMLHYAGIGSGASFFYNKVKSIDYDYIGLSYYPIWHGKNLNDVASTINNLSRDFNKKVVIAETSYPFTFSYNDYTNNIIGDNSQILNEFPASNNGQLAFLQALKAKIKSTANGIGFCYWGAEWIAFKGKTATDGSSWENQALWDFDNKALPAMQVFSKN